MALSSAVVLALLGLGWTSHLRHHSFVGVTGLAVGWGLLQLAVLMTGLAQPPGKRPPRLLRWGVVAGALVFALLHPVFLLLSGCSQAASKHSGLVGGLGCAALSFLCGALVAGIMLRIWRRTDPFSPRLSGAMLGLSGGLAGAVGVGFTCEDHGVAHLWLGHFSAVVLLTFLGKLAGSRCLTP